MLLKAGVHRSWEEKLDAGLGLVNGRSVHISLTSILDVSFHALLDLHDDFTRQIGEKLDGFLLPSHTRIRFEEVRNVIICRLCDRALKDLTAFSTTEVSVVLRNEDLVETVTANYSSFSALLL